MVGTLQLLLLLANWVVAGLTMVFCVQVLTALLWRAPHPKRSLMATQRPRVAVLIPAHNEDAHLVPTVRDVLAQLRDGDRICVVADNCSDRTAEYAHGAGAEVVERYDPVARGKSYALDFGIRYLSDDPPEIVIIVDADCRLGESTIDHLVETCCTTGRPVQGCYIILAPEGAGAGVRIAEFAQVVKNRLRPRGYQALGLPCQLAGSGMALPWPAVCAVNLANGEAVEDLKLGLDLTAAGFPPIFCADAEVTSFFPTSATSAANQRQRWQHGHLRMIILSIPRLLTGAVHGNKHLVALTLDLMVPPLTLLLLTLTVLLSVGIAGVSLGTTSMLVALPASSLAFLLSVTLAAWLSFERRPPAAGGLRALASFIAERSVLYPRFLATARSVAWVRTQRENVNEPGALAYLHSTEEEVLPKDR